MASGFFGRKWPKREPEQPPAPTADRLTVYFHTVSDEYDFRDGDHVTMAGFHPFHDTTCLDPVEETIEAPSAEGIFYFRLAGGTFHRADLERPEFEVGALVRISHDDTIPGHPNALRVCSLDSRYTAGFLPHALGEKMAPHLPAGFSRQGVVLQTVVRRDGSRIGLRIIGSVGRELATVIVDRPRSPSPPGV